ncbi:MAG TPA: rod shape-determining protein [Candidatus Paceibacterota bacterium]|nr:rod shape-determining protein [Candidatus Paceibacterota bacterium]
MRFFKGLKTDIGIDLGTANSLVYLKGEGVVFNEPTMIAINNKTGQVVAIGNEAKRMMGRTPTHIDVIRPLVNGVISDFLMAQEVLKHFIKKIKKDSLFNYIRAVVAIPTNLTEVERKSVEDAVISSGAASSHLIEEPVVALLGASLPIDEPTAHMVVDIGGGTSEIAVVSLGGVVVSRSLKIAGDKMNNEIIRYVHDDFKMAIGEPTAERVKIEIGSMITGSKPIEMTIAGRDLSTGLPKEVSIKDSQVRMALMPSVRQIIDAIRDTIEKTPPELAGDILRRGLYLSGGGSMLRGFSDLVSKEVGVKTIIVDDPLTCVVRGTGVAAENIEHHKPIFALSVRPINIE